MLSDINLGEFKMSFFVLTNGSVPVLSAWCSCHKYLHRAVPRFLDIITFHPLSLLRFGRFLYFWRSFPHQSANDPIQVILWFVQLFTSCWGRITPQLLSCWTGNPSSLETSWRMTLRVLSTRGKLAGTTQKILPRSY